MGYETQSQFVCAVLRANVKFRYGSERALGVKGIAFIKGNKSCRIPAPATSDKHKVLLTVKEVLESGCRFGKVEIERLNTNGVHDLSQQLANHYSDLLRVAGNRPLDREVRAHFMEPNVRAHARAREIVDQSATLLARRGGAHY